jgi:hypothetical protein
MHTKTFFSIAVYLIAGYFNLLYSQALPILDLATAIDHPSKIVLSDFIGTLTYIPLETTKDCLVGAYPDIKVTKDYIVVSTQNQCLLFDRKNGSFLREIGHYGRGPGEFRSTSGFLDELSSIYYFRGWNGNLIKYSLDGRFLGSLAIPGYNSSLQQPSIPEKFTYLPGNLIACNFMNTNGFETKSLMIFNNNGEIVKVIPNRHILQNMNQVISTGNASFHNFNNSAFFQEYYNDTVFKITSERISPYFILNKGKYRPLYESLWWPVEKQRQIKLINQPIYRESSRFISFDFYFIFNQGRFFALYDKPSKSLRITENLSGIRNDIDGFIDLTFKSINESGELSSIIQSEELISWLEINKEKTKSLKPDLQNLKNIQLGDNPVVVIAKYKQ